MLSLPRCVMALSFVVCLAWTSLLSAEPPAGMRVATFRCDITPPLGQPLAGADALKTVQQPLLAKGVVLEAGGQRYVLCALDWCILANDSYRSMRGKVAAAAGTDAARVALQCVHQHTAPIVGFDDSEPTPATDPKTPRPDPKAYQAIGDRLAAAVKESLDRFEPFDRVGTGQAKVDRVASDRRIKDAAGKIPVRWSLTKDLAVRNLPEGHIDPYLKTITLAAGEKPLVRLHYYATHPQTLYRDGRATSDVPGDAREGLEQKEGVFQIYFNGCGGDITLGKYNDGTPECRAALAARLRAGMEAAIAATRLVPATAIQWQTYPLSLPWKTQPGSNRKDDCRPPIELTALKIGNIHIVHLPGEPMLCFQQFAQSIRPNDFVAVAGYGDGATGYICPESAFGEGGYEPTGSEVKPESEPLVKRGIASLLGVESTALPAKASLIVHPHAGTYDVEAAAPAVGAITGSRLGLEVDGQTLWADAAKKVAWSGDASGRVAAGQSATACYEFESPPIEWSVEFKISDDGTMPTVTSEIRNRGERPLKLGKCRLLETGGTSQISLGANPEKTLMLAVASGGWKNMVRRIADAKTTLRAKTLAPLFNPAAEASLLLGFLTFDRVDTEVQAEWVQAARGIALRGYCDFDGYALPAGRSVRSERLMVTFNRDPQQALATWADAASAQYKQRNWPKNPAGWVGWSWDDAFSVVRYEDVVRRNAAAVSRRLPGYGVDYIWVSCGNLKDMIPGNWLDWNTESFSTPPERLIKDLQGQGFKFGLWIAPFWMCDHADPRLVEEMRDAFLLHDGKPLVVPYRWYFGIGAKMAAKDRPNMYVLDPTHPKTQAFLKKVFSTYYAWGVRYYMIDFLECISGLNPGRHLYDSCHQNDLIHGPEVYRVGLKAVREAAGPDTYLLGTNPSAALAGVGVYDGCRVGTDYGEGRPLAPDAGFYPGTFVINEAKFWTSHRTGTDTLATQRHLHRKFFLADTGNVLTLDKPCPLSEAQIAATIFGINGGPMMLGDNIERMGEDRLAMVKKCLPRLPEAARSIDLFECPEPDHPKVFHLPVQTAWDHWDLVALFNYSDAPREYTLDLKRLGLNAEADYVVWDFWNERFDGTCRGTLKLLAAPQSVKLVRLSLRRPHPWLMSTDMHVRQGQAEIEDCQWDAAAMTLKFRARRPAGERSSVFVLAPRGLEVTNPGGLSLAKDGRSGNGSLIIRAALDFSGGPEERTIRFAPSRNSKDRKAPGVGT